MTFVSLFAGIGGFDLGLERAGMTCVGQVEIDPYATRVLQKHWPDVPKHDDVRTFKGDEFGPFHLLTGGYPCQPFSNAGLRRGESDERHLWPEVLRIIRNVRPQYVLLENVPGHLSLGFGRVLGDLAESGYDAEWDCIPAAAVGAPHLRDRVFILAYPNGERQKRGRSEQVGWAEPRRGRQEVADTDSGGRVFGQAQEHPTDRRLHAQRHPRASRETLADPDREQTVGTPIAWGERHPWKPEPDVGRVANGVPAELDFVRGVIGDESDYPKAEPEAQELVWRVLREVWEHRTLATASPDLYRARLHDLVPSLPRERAQGGWLLGKRIEEDEELCDLWRRVSSQSFQEAHDLLPSLLERIGAKKRPAALGSRVDRLRTLGNAVVPQVAEWIGRRILEVAS